MRFVRLSGLEATFGPPSYLRRQMRKIADFACLLDHQERNLAHMSAKSSEQLINVLRATVVQVEQASGVAPDDPALVELKRIVLHRIADLELAHAVEPSEPPDGTDYVGVSPASDLQEATDDEVMAKVQSKPDNSA